MQYPPGHPSAFVAQKPPEPGTHCASLVHAAPTGTVQLPNEHAEPLGQTVPHEPQCVALVDVFTHAPPHEVSPVPHRQLPALHV
jgi:hypothetical protein